MWRAIEREEKMQTLTLLKMLGVQGNSYSCIWNGSDELTWKQCKDTTGIVLKYEESKMKNTGGMDKETSREIMFWNAE